MANVVKVTVSYDDGSTADFMTAADFAAAHPAPTETVSVTPGESVEVVAEAAPVESAPASDAPAPADAPAS